MPTVIHKYADFETELQRFMKGTFTISASVLSDLIGRFLWSRHGMRYQENDVSWSISGKNGNELHINARTHRTALLFCGENAQQGAGTPWHSFDGWKYYWYEYKTSRIRYFDHKMMKDYKEKVCSIL